MKDLINGQSIRIEKHDAGSGREVSFDHALHIHKVMNRDRFNGAEIIIPLNVNAKFKIIKSRGRNSDIESHIRNEIKKALKNPQKRLQFAEYFFREIERYSQNQNDPIRISNLIESANAIAEYFGLLREITEGITTKIENLITSYSSKHIDSNGKEYYIIQDLNGQNIRIGSDLEILKDWEETKRIFNS